MSASLTCGVLPTVSVLSWLNLNSTQLNSVLALVRVAALLPVIYHDCVTETRGLCERRSPLWHCEASISLLELKSERFYVFFFSQQYP